MGKSRPYRPFRSIPRFRTNSDRRKALYYEYGNDHKSIFVDIVNGNADLVDKVGIRFWPSGETHNITKRQTVQLSDGTLARRFTLKQSEVQNWSRKVTVVVFGKGGSRRRRRLTVKPRYFRERPLRFLETRGLRQRYVTAAPHLTFGVELELSLSGTTYPETVVTALQQHANVVVLDKTGHYKRGTEDYSKWQLVPDGSTSCNRSDPNCNKFELVSRVLAGEAGLQECERVLYALQTVGKISINKSMGFHVHVNAEGLSLENIKNICLNYVKHEAAIDSFMPPSRKDGPYCQSNQLAVLSKNHVDDKGLQHNAIASCDNLFDLCRMVNPNQGMGPRYFKLNLQNLLPNSSKKRAKPTIEFRQHSGTTNYAKIEAWVRFCTAFCRHSVERPPKLKHYEDAFESLFDTVIQDIRLKDYYRSRRHQLFWQHQNYYSQDQDHEDPACCDACGKDGGTCQG